MAPSFCWGGQATKLLDSQLGNSSALTNEVYPVIADDMRLLGVTLHGCNILLVCFVVVVIFSLHQNSYELLPSATVRTKPLP